MAPPGCKNVTLGVKVYPLPEFLIVSAEILPSTTVASICATVDPSLVGASTTTVGGFVSLYPLPEDSNNGFLIH